MVSLRKINSVFAAACMLFASGALGLAETAQDQPVLPPLSDEVADQFTAVGRVNTAGFKTKGSCSGTLIRPDVVLTAGHCTNETEGPTTQVFVAGWRRGDYVAARGFSKQRKHPAYRVNGKHDPRFDVGLLFLETPITDVDPIPLAQDRADAVAVLGYHSFIPHLLSGRLDCPVNERSDKVIFIGCPVISGNSGGPVLEPDGAGGWVLTAVVSSKVRGGALATRIPAWVHDMLAEHENS